MHVIAGGTMKQISQHNGEVDVGDYDEDDSNPVWRMFSDVHVLDRRTMEWECVLADGGSMPRRRGHSAVLHEPTKRIIIFGGVGSSDPSGLDMTPPSNEREALLGDLWVLHTDPAYSWEQPTMTGSKPAARRGHRAVILSDASTMVVVGGYPAHYRDRYIGLHALRIGRWDWEDVLIDGNPPRGLALFGCCCVADTLFVFGGHEFLSRGERQMVNTLWHVDLSELRLHESSPAASVATSEVDVSEPTRGRPNAAPVVSWHIVESTYRDPALQRANMPTPAEVRLQLLPDDEMTPPPRARFCTELVASPAVRDSTHIATLFVFGGTDEGVTLDDMHRLDVCESNQPERPTEGMAEDQERSTSLPMKWVYSSELLAGGRDREDPSAAVQVAGAAIPEQPVDHTRTLRERTRELLGGATSSEDPRNCAAADAETRPDATTNHPRSAAPPRPILDAAPTARNGMSLLATGRSLLLFGGGVYAQAYYNELWEFDPLKGRAVRPTPLGGGDATGHPLISHLGALMCTARFADVLISVSDGGAPVPAHKLILAMGASDYFLMALGGAHGFLEAERAASGEQVSLTMPENIKRVTLLVVLRWMYTGAPPAAALDAELLERAGVVSPPSDGASSGVDDDSPDSCATVRVVSALVAADALGIDGLRATCEQWLSERVADENVCEILAIAEELHCPRLPIYCLTHLRESFGARNRRCPSDSAHTAALGIQTHVLGVPRARPVPEAFDALSISQLPGFDRLSASARTDLVWHVGLPAEALVGSAAEIQQQAATAIQQQALATGMEVRIHGMSVRTDLNTRKGVLLGFDAPKGRWCCRVEATQGGLKEEVAIRAANLTGLDLTAWW